MSMKREKERALCRGNLISRKFLQARGPSFSLARAAVSFATCVIRVISFDHYTRVYVYARALSSKFIVSRANYIFRKKTVRAFYFLETKKKELERLRACGEGKSSVCTGSGEERNPAGLISEIN